MCTSKKKAAIDCTGEVIEAITNVPLLIINDVLTDEDAIGAYNKMKEGWAAEYRRWKDAFIDFGDDDD